MKRFICCFAASIFLSAAFSQKLYFVYLQSETQQPFFVRTQEDVISSTSSGYLILSKLRDSSYTLRVGFPENQWPEQTFTVNVAARDRGFLLKRFPEKGWGLFDLQTLSVIMAEQGKGTTKTQLKAVSPFTEVLSRAANDPSLKEKVVQIEPVAAKEEKKAEMVPNAETVVPVKKEDATAIANEKETVPTEPVVKTNQPVKDESPATIKENAPGSATGGTIAAPSVQEKPAVALEQKELGITEQSVQAGLPGKEERSPVAQVKTIEEKKVDPAPALEQYKPSVVKRKSESSTTEGFGLTFVDEYADGRTDTIRIIIPETRVPYKTVVKEQPKGEVKFLDITTEAKEKAAEARPLVENATKKPAKVIACTSVADESDFLKLRKRMAGGNNDREMVNEATKYFKSKCFSVQQLKNLSTLFLNDKGKYQFFDAAYAAVLDRENFSSLAAELKDEEYVSQFRSLLQ